MCIHHVRGKTSPSATRWEVAPAAITVVLNDQNVGGWKLVVGELRDGRLPGDLLDVWFLSVAGGVIG